MAEKKPEERAALLVWHLAHGDAFSTTDAAKMTGLSPQGARRLLASLSRVVPIYQDGRLWQVLAMWEAEV